MGQLIVIVAMFALLWLFLIMPQRRRAQAQKELISGVEVGDEILTVGGVYGHVRAIDEEGELEVEIAPETRVRVARRAVARGRPARGGGGHGGRGPRGRGSVGAREAFGSKFRAERANQLPYVAAPVNRRPHLTLVALIVAGLIGVGLLAVPGTPIQKDPTLGLDLQGGLEVTLQAVPPPNRPLQESDLDRSVEILRDRVDRLGAEPEIRKQGDDQIVIDLPGVDNPEQVIEILGKTASLELFDLQANLVPPSIGAQRFPIAKESIYALLAGQQSLVSEDDETTWYLFDDKRKLRAGPKAERAELLQTDAAVEAGLRPASCPRAGGSSACRPRQPSSAVVSARSSVRASTSRTRRRTRTT